VTENGRALTLRAVNKTFGRHRALIDLSVRFLAGQVAAVLGPNGAGKSTLLGILSTLVRPSTGELAFGDELLSRHSAIRTTIGYVGHEPGLYGDLTARQNLELFGALYGVPQARDRLEQMLTRVGLAEVRRDAIARTFSRGMLQRLALARALLPEPQILLFDEPSSALDPAGAAWLAEEINRERAAGRLVVLVTHDLEAAASVATHLVILRRGRMVLDETRAGGFPAATVRALYEERTHV
jgi:ABC-type multidrug transport system ATPase subunit